MNTNDSVWHCGYNGPRCCLFMKFYKGGTNATDRAVICFQGIPEVVLAEDVFASKAECYQEAGLRKLKEAARCSSEAAELMGTAAEERKKERETKAS